MRAPEPRSLARVSAAEWGSRRSTRRPPAIGSGSRWCARLEKQPRRGGEEEFVGGGKPRLRRRQHQRQCRRRRRRGRGGELDQSADRATGIDRTVGLRNRRITRPAHRCGHGLRPAGIGHVHMGERQRELDRQRKQRQAGPQPDMPSEPAHSLRAHHSPRLPRRRAGRFCYCVTLLARGQYCPPRPRAYGQLPLSAILRSHLGFRRPSGGDE
jgi:hypothetical protein